jgi:hypothetical protein
MFTQAEPIRIDAVVSTVLLHAHTPQKHPVLTGILPHLRLFPAAELTGLAPGVTQNCPQCGAEPYARMLLTK